MSTQVTTEVATTLEECAYQIELSQTSAIWNLLTIGEHLSVAREAIRQEGTRDFAEWANTRLKMSKSAAYRAISVFERLGKRPSLGRIEITAAYELAMGDTSPEAIEEAFERANSGEKVTATVAREIKEKHAPRKESPSELRPMAVSAPVETDEPTADTDDESDSAACDEPPRAVKAKAEAGPVEPSWALYFSKQIDEALADALAGLEKHDFTVRVGVAAYLREYADKIQGAK